ncbi:MAG TPA: tRNA (N6-threonylcarbamoyladenosine(37)-N6)-methyltransferase TrmO [Syntrophorhabdaceae bacterium]|nr:tRNA (N6-threonylcarbamoyladenosine(37)-N6)-methyltransferase TrmO [Syntrophorhabdaceae bacterium]
MTCIELRPIGVIRSPYKTKEETPIQGVFRPEMTGWVELYPGYGEGLKDIEGFSHIFLIYNFDRVSARAELVRPVLLDDQPHGIFACRFPSRPNSIGLTVVELFGREGSKLKVGGIDVLDNTPLLDIKPYVPRFDSFPKANEGWFKGKNERPKPPGRE